MPSMDITKELHTNSVATSCSLKDVSSKTAALDRERFEVACLRQDIIDEYEQKSRELLDYLFKLETEFKIQQQEFEEREAILRHENEVLKDELNRRSKIAKRTLFTKRQKYHQLGCQDVESTSRIFKNKTSVYEWNYQLEHKRAEELKAFVDELQLELLRAEEVALQWKKRMEQSKQRMELENQELRRKAALGWMLGCLSELYLRIDPKVGGAGIMKLVRKVQRELECGSSFNERGLQHEALQGEVHRIIGSSHASQLRNVVEPCTTTTTTMKENISRGGIRPCNTSGDDRDEPPRERRKQWQKYNALNPHIMKANESRRPTTSPSIFADIHEDRSQKTSEKNNFWIETYPMVDAPLASRESLKAETVGLLKGLEKSMSFLLSKEKKNHGVENTC